MSLDEELKAIAEGSRVYASLREGGTKRQKELSVLIDLLESMEREGCVKYSQPEIAPVDPPDCTAHNALGSLAAFEITEFVSREAIELNEKARPEHGKRPALDRMVMAAWNQESMVTHITALLAAKDQKKYLGGPYAEYVAVIHTDEPLLVRTDAEKWLGAALFGPYSQLTSAYFLYNYEPGKGYPFQMLRFRAA